MTELKAYPPHFKVAMNRIIAQYQFDLEAHGINEALKLYQNRVNELALEECQRCEKLRDIFRNELPEQLSEWHTYNEKQQRYILKVLPEIILDGIMDKPVIGIEEVVTRRLLSMASMKEHVEALGQND